MQWNLLTAASGSRNEELRSQYEAAVQWDNEDLTGRLLFS